MKKIHDKSLIFYGIGTLHKFYQTQDGAVSKQSGNHGQERRKRKHFGRTMNNAGEKDAQQTDTTCCNKGCHRNFQTVLN